MAKINNMHRCANVRRSLRSELCKNCTNNRDFGKFFICNAGKDNGKSLLGGK